MSDQGASRDPNSQQKEGMNNIPMKRGAVGDPRLNLPFYGRLFLDFLVIFIKDKISLVFVVIALIYLDFSRNKISNIEGFTKKFQ